MIGTATICLNMIVKNEAAVIGRCLGSVKPLLDYWVIVDTGSTDGTQDLVRAALSDVPGEVVERPWVDFAHNRTEAIAAARGKADYLLFMDADWVWHPTGVVPPLEKDLYFVLLELTGVTYRGAQLAADRLPWRYVGVLHEYLWCPEEHTEALLEGARILNLGDGARSRDPLKYRRDALVLERALLDEPQNERYVFYLAQSYRDAGDLDLAIRHYHRRVEMGGWIEEVWYSQLQIADAMARQGKEWASVLAAYLAAYERRPQRAEPLFRIARHYMDESQFETAGLFLDQAARVPYPAEDKLFVEHGLYRYIIAMERAVCAYWRGRHEEAIRLNNALLACSDLPQEHRGRVIENRRFSLDALHLPAPP